MFENRNEFQKTGIAFIQLVAVFAVITIINLISNFSLTNKDIVMLMLLHIVAFYISNYNYHFFQRGYLIEFTETLKYSAFYAVIITFSSFMLGGNFSLSRSNLIFFILLNALGVYCINLSIKQYYARVHPRLKSSKKVLIITVSNRLDRILKQLTEARTFNECNV